MTAVLTDNLPLLVGAPNGIKKLRELILELAVRGNLLEQNVADEPASELLKLIAEERKQLVAKGKTREHAPLQEIDKASAPYKAASGWLWIKLGDISLIERGGSPRPIKDFLTEDSDGLNWIKIGDTDKGGKYITSAGEKIRREGLFKTRMVYPGDFLLTNSMSFGRPYITQIEGCIHDGWLRISPPASLVKDYLFLLLSSPYVRSFFVQAAAGAVVLNLNADKVRELPIPLPPLAEQHRIVAKVDELMALCDHMEAQQSGSESAHAQLVQVLLESLAQTSDATDFATNWQRLAEHFHTLFTTELSIDAFKQTLLQLAVMGRLVPQDSSDESANKLLKRIAEAKARLVTEGKIRKQKPLTEIAEDEKLFELQTGWEWSRLGSLVVESGAGWSPSCESRPREGTEWGVLKVSAVSWSVYQPEENKALPMNLDARPEYEVTEGDFLITRANTAELVARSVVVDKTPSRLMLSDKIVRLKLTNWCDSHYVNLINSTTYARQYYARVAGGTSSSMKNVSREQILNLPIALPPLAEQHRIVAKFNQLIALCDQLKTRLIHARQLNEQLAITMVERALAEPPQTNSRCHGLQSRANPSRRRNHSSTLRPTHLRPT